MNKNYQELNSKDYFNEKKLREYPLFASVFVANIKPNDGFFFSARYEKKDTRGMRISQTKYNDFSILIRENDLNFIFNYLYVILSDKMIFPNIGNCSHLMKINSFDYGHNHSNDLNFDIDETGRSKFDSNRRILHEFLLEIAIRLLLFHECRHLINGHNGFLNSLGIDNSTDGIKKGLLTNLDLHTLEMDADSIAIQDLIKNINSKNSKLVIPYDLNNKDGILKSILFVSFILFKILPHKHYQSIEDIKKSTHPSSSFRFGMLTVTLEAYLRQNDYNDLALKLDSYIVETIQMFSTSIKKISNEIFDIEEIIMFYSDKGLEYLNEVVYNWNFLKPKLENFAFAKLAPYTPEYIRKINNFHYSTLVSKINMVKFNYISILFSHKNLLSQFKNPEFYSQNNTHVFSVDGTENGKVELTFQNLLEMIATFRNYFEKDYPSTCMIAIQSNVSFIRTKAISELYSLLNEYFKNSKVLLNLQSFNWFKVLTILNNSILKPDNSLEVSFLKSFNNKDVEAFEIEWNDIYIRDNQLYSSIKYNDKQIIELLDLIIVFLNKNINEYILDKS